MEPLLPPHGGYRKLKSFQVAQLAFDMTVRFCNRYVDKRSRTTDQMVQAARSGVQNIVEGSMASGTSKKMEIKLTNVARASLEELRMDYEDYLRQRSHEIWNLKHPLRTELIARRFATVEQVAMWTREVHGRYRLNGPDGQAASSSIPSIKSTPSIKRPTHGAIAANTTLVLVTVACSLLDRQLAAQATQFEKDGGFTERLHRVRSANRGY
jgi:four helix bundle suffix protein